MNDRIAMKCQLIQWELSKKINYEKISRQSIPHLAKAMLDAYKDTVDDEGERVDDLIRALYCIIEEGQYGIFLPDASFQIQQNGMIISAILVSLYHNQPLIVSLFTRKKYMNLGIAGSLMKKSMNALREQGYDQLNLFVHKENKNAMHLYKKMGFKTQIKNAI